MLLNPYRFVGGAGTDPFFSNVVLLLRGDGVNGSTAIVDSSSRNRTPIITGSTQITTTSPKFGTGSIAFDGVDDALSYADSTDFDLDGDFTIEMFVWFSSLAGTRAIFSKKDNDNGAGWVQVYKNTGNGQAVFAISTDGATNAVVYTSGAVFATDTWHHVAVVREANTVRFFVGGVLLHSTSLTAKPSVNTSPLRFGQAGASNLYDMFGKLEQIRITKGVARYSASFTPPVAQFPAQ